jgi:hypothetical protein
VDDTGAGATGSTGEIKFDLGNAGDLPGGNCDPEDPDCGCTAVDILFVIDNSGSMQEHAPGVTAAFDTFVDEMVASVPPGTSLHVGVTRATGFWDPGDGSGWGGDQCTFTLFPDIAMQTWSPPPADNGINGQQGRLFEHQGLRFFDLDTANDPQPLRDWFEGALGGAIDGFAPHSNSETVVAGAAYPFHPENADYNAGFMREQAVLVLFLLSDAPDMSPPNVMTSEYVAMVSDAKAACGDQCILTTGAIAEICYQNPANTNTRLTDFMDGFGMPATSHVNLQAGNTPDFSGVLGAALAEVIATTCENIPPQG